MINSCTNLCAAFRKIGGEQRTFLGSSSSALPSAQNFYVRVAYLRVTCFDFLQYPSSVSPTSNYVYSFAFVKILTSSNMFHLCFPVA